MCDALWPNKKVTVTLIFKASDPRNMFKSTQFHAVCDNRGPTLSVIRSTNGSIFGGYFGGPFAGTKFGYKTADEAFVFSYSRPSCVYDTNTCCTFPIHGTEQIFSSSGFGPAFGKGHDFCVINEGHKVAGSYSKFPFSCELCGHLPADLELHRGDIDWCTFLAGSATFFLEDYEVYTIQMSS